MKLKALPTFLGVVLVALYALWLAWPITIITADIGRHITDGMVFFTHPEWRHALLHNNFYSVSNPDFSIINHHWLAGPLLYLVKTGLGWKGLHLVSMTLCIGALLLFTRVAAKFSNGVTALSVAILLLPMIAYRLEIRPEFFGYFLAALIVYILHTVTKEGANVRRLWVIPVLCALWVNLHASFPVGMAVVVLFTADAYIRQSDFKKPLTICLVLSGLALLVNPSGIYGALYPLSILKDPGYAVVENQSILFLSSVGVTSTAFLLLKVSAFLLLVLCAVIAYRKSFRDAWPYIAVSLLTVLMAWLAVRHITLAGYFLIPVFSYGFFLATKSLSAKAVKYIAAATVCVSILWQGYTLSNRWLVLGLEPKANAAAEFMKENNIEGPLFNNFDIGGYVIYHFFPDIKPYVYNRPESHPSDFWRNTYIPVMQDNTKWNALVQQEQFNAIMLFHGDRTTWAQKFLVNRIKDPEWVAVFVDQSIIVFVRQNGKNAELISRYAIPASTLLK